METAELLEIVARGEDTRHQFKADATNANALAAEIVALANASGGEIFIGIANDGTPEPHDRRASGDSMSLLRTRLPIAFARP